MISDFIFITDLTRSNQSILKEINPKYSEELMLKLNLQYFGHLMQTANSLEKTLMLGKTEGKRRRRSPPWDPPRLDRARYQEGQRKGLGRVRRQGVALVWVEQDEDMAVG